MTTIPPLPPADLDHRFRYHSPTPEQPAVYELLRDLAHQLALVVSVVTVPSREQSLALTKLEEAVMHANSAVARHGLTDDGTAPPVTILQGATDVLRDTKPDSTVVAFCPAGWDAESHELVEQGTEWLHGAPENSRWVLQFWNTSSGEWMDASQAIGVSLSHAEHILGNAERDSGRPHRIVRLGA